jgi:very-long-chain ceramide synthase
MPKARPYTSKFFTLSQYNEATGKYFANSGDFYFLAFCVVLFTGLRASCMEHVLAPLAKAWGISKRKDITRFSEQAWLLVYYLIFWPLGFVCSRTTNALRTWAQLTLVSSISTTTRPTG